MGEGTFQMQMAYCVECGTATRDTLVENCNHFANRPCSSSSIHSDFHQMTTNFSNVACLFIEKSIFNAVNFHKFRLKKTKYFEKELPRITNFCKA